MDLVPFMFDDDLRVTIAFYHLSTQINHFPESLYKSLIFNNIICTFKLKSTGNHHFGSFWIYPYITRTSTILGFISIKKQSTRR